MAQEGRSQEAIPAVTHVRLKMKGAPGSRPGGALSIYDISINARDPSARQESNSSCTKHLGMLQHSTSIHVENYLVDAEISHLQLL